MTGQFEIAAIARVLSEPVRVHILRQLLADDAAIMFKHIDVPVTKSTLSYHLSVLEQHGFIDTQREGRDKWIVLGAIDADLEGWLRSEILP